MHVEQNVSVTIKNADFYNNNEIDNARPVMQAGRDSYVSIQDTIIENHTSPISPVYIYQPYFTFIDGIVCENNAVINDDSSEPGGCILIQFSEKSTHEIIVQNSIFKNNSAGEGGGLEMEPYFTNEYDYNQLEMTIELNNNTFISNTAMDNKDVGGGFVLAPLEETDVDVILNINVIVRDTMFLSNIATYGYGGGYHIIVVISHFPF